MASIKNVTGIRYTTNLSVLKFQKMIRALRWPWLLPLR